MYKSKLIYSQTKKIDKLDERIFTN